MKQLSDCRLLLVDDAKANLDILVEGLKGDHKLSLALNGETALQIAQRMPPDLVLLDIVMPGLDGYEVCRRLRAMPETAEVPIIFLSSLEDVRNKSQGFEAGANDYVTKPFDLRELVARCKAVLRRSTSRDTPVASRGLGDAGKKLAFDRWVLDISARHLSGPEGPVELTTGEFELLLTFARHPGRVLSRDFLLEQTRGREAGPFDRTIDVQIGRLRKKLELDPERPQVIKSVRGAGYILVPAVRAG